MKSKYICAVPIVQAFINNSGGFRNCCVTRPTIESKPEENFDDWWNGSILTGFRESLTSNRLPNECKACYTQESINGRSLRTVINETVDINNLKLGSPSRWHIMFGNICNLACWSCGPKFSSVIENHYIKVGMLENFISPQQNFENKWPSLKNQILKSYEEHEFISITLGGGEPFYNKDVYDFLLLLKEKNLSSRTKLEFNTNATQYNARLVEVLENTEWNGIVIRLSIDAIGKKAEWLRYGSKWNIIEKNIPHYIAIANYIEVACSLTVLNIKDLPDLKKYCETMNLKLRVNPIITPAFMSLINWDHDPAELVSREFLEKYNFHEFYDLIGKNSIPGSKEKLRNYIMKFKGIRDDLSNYDLELAKALSV